MSLTKAQKKANARNQLFRQIHGYSLTPFIDRASTEKAITPYEEAILRNIEDLRKKLISKQFEGSKEVGLNPRRRCSCCNGIARWQIAMFGELRYYCNKHKEELERDNKQNYKGEYLVQSITPINPNK